MKNHKLYNGVWVAPTSRTYDLLESKDPNDQKMAARLQAYCEKATKCNYDVKIIAQLRDQYKDVL